MVDFQTFGFGWARGVFSGEELAMLRDEADHIARKMGSACVRHLRFQSKGFDQLATSDRLLRLLPQGLSPVRSILFDKMPELNWSVAWHQDLTIAVQVRKNIEGYGPWSTKEGSVHVQPPVDLLQKMLPLRIHLDETPETNGALRVVPGSHRMGKIPSCDVGNHVKGAEVVCACQAGDVLVMSPLLLHASSRSKSPNRRRILHMEYAPLDLLDPRLSWLEETETTTDFRRK